MCDRATVEVGRHHAWVLRQVGRKADTGGSGWRGIFEPFKIGVVHFLSKIDGLCRLGVDIHGGKCMRERLSVKGGDGGGWGQRLVIWFKETFDFKFRRSVGRRRPNSTFRGDREHTRRRSSLDGGE